MSEGTDGFIDWKKKFKEKKLESIIKGQKIKELVQSNYNLQIELQAQKKTFDKIQYIPDKRFKQSPQEIDRELIEKEKLDIKLKSVEARVKSLTEETREKASIIDSTKRENESLRRKI